MILPIDMLLKPVTWVENLVESLQYLGCLASELNVLQGDSLCRVQKESMLNLDSTRIEILAY